MAQKFGSIESGVIESPNNNLPADEPAEIVPQPVESVEPVEQALEAGNMTDVAIRHHLIINSDVVQKTEMFNGFTGEQWTFASDFDMTPEKLEQYSGKKIADLIAEQAK